MKHTILIGTALLLMMSCNNLKTNSTDELPPPLRANTSCRIYVTGSLSGELDVVILEDPINDWVKVSIRDREYITYVNINNINWIYDTLDIKNLKII